MSESAGNDAGGRAVTLDDLIALNDEIVALTRAGVPLERGLAALSGDLPGRLRRLTAALGERMGRGESLGEALRGAGAGIPTVYRAVVEAGLRSGRLSTALEGLSTYARGFAEARQSVLLAAWYPLLVLALAYALFVGVVALVMPRFLAAFAGLGLALPWSLRLLQRAHETLWLWGPLVPTILVALVATGVLSGRAGWMGAHGAFGFLRWLPLTGAILRSYEAAGFADTLALLLDHGVPYGEAVVLAGDASGDPALAESSREVAAAVGRGLPPDEAWRNRTAFPPLLAWVLASGPRFGDLTKSLRLMGARYRSAARFHADLLRLLLPTTLLFVIGVTATVLYALTLFLPLTELWRGIASQAP